MFRITYKQGNGYRCSCCRHTWTETTDLETREDVLDWLVDLQASKTISTYEDEDDRKVISIEESIGNDIKNEFVIDIQKVDKKIQWRKEQKQKEEQENNEKEMKQKEEDEKALLKQLLEKYPEEVQT